MVLSVQVLCDAPKLDDKPLRELLYYIRERDGVTGKFQWSDHYECQGQPYSVVSLHILRTDLDTYFEEHTEGPPDIREWLDERIKEGYHLAWVGW